MAPAGNIRFDVNWCGALLLLSKLFSRLTVLAARLLGRDLVDGLDLTAQLREIGLPFRLLLDGDERG